MVLLWGWFPWFRPRTERVHWSVMTGQALLERLQPYSANINTTFFPEEWIFFVAEESHAHPVAFLAASNILSRRPVAELVCVNKKAIHVLNLDPNVWSTFRDDTGFRRPVVHDDTRFISTTLASEF